MEKINVYYTAFGSVFGVLLVLVFVNCGVQSEYVNSTSDFFTRNFPVPATDAFQFSNRIPKKPFTQKNNFLSFETKNDNIEVNALL